jgi:HSP20 family protein
VNGTELARNNRLDSLRQMRAVMDRFFPWSFGPASDVPFVGDNLALDVYDEGADLVVKAALPGVKPGDVKVTLTEGVLEISASARTEQEVSETDYYLREYTTRAWHRSLRLPDNVKADKASATYADGFLTLRVPRTNGATPRSVEVKVS